MSHTDLSKAKKGKNDEFHTQYIDIQKEVSVYLEYNPDVFKGKVIYCNTDDPFESNFFKYFVLNFNRLGIKQLIVTSYINHHVVNTQLSLFSNDKPLQKLKGRPKITANKFIINDVKDIDGDGEFNLKDVTLQLKENKNNEWAPLKENGDFRSAECIAILKQSDIVITNPPFSLFLEYTKQLFDYNKKFLIIGNINCLTYRDIFKKIKQNEIWMGGGMGRWISGFIVPKSYELYGTETRIDENGDRIVATNNCLWLTNLDHGKRHQPISLMTIADNKKFNKKLLKKENSYKKYDNYDAIEVPYTDAIPSDYDAIIGVPITFLDKYNPDQFEIIGQMVTTKIDEFNHGYPYVGGKKIYARILIKHKKDIS